MTSRIKYDPPSKYSNRVLVGPWVYDRLNSVHHHQELYSHNSVYKTDYIPKNVQPNVNVVWDQKLKAHGSNVGASKVGCYHSPSYFENFTTLYDLSYNHFPKCTMNTIPRKWKISTGIHQPIDEYLQTFGNQTNFGLREQKREKWRYNNADPRVTHMTNFQCEFQSYTPDQYKFKRFFIPTYNTEKISETELKNFKHKRRFKAIHEVIESTLLCAHGKGYYNPLTWECTPDLCTQNMSCKS